MKVHGFCLPPFFPHSPSAKNSRPVPRGKQLSDSKGASAAISTEAAVLSVRRVAWCVLFGANNSGTTGEKLGETKGNCKIHGSGMFVFSKLMENWNELDRYNLEGFRRISLWGLVIHCQLGGFRIFLLPRPCVASWALRTSSATPRPKLLWIGERLHLDHRSGDLSLL